jgi:hypothetical protein
VFETPVSALSFGSQPEMKRVIAAEIDDIIKESACFTAPCSEQYQFK